MAEKHIGKLIAARLKILGMSKAEFGRRMSMSRQNVSLVLRKRNLDTALVRRATDVLDYDLFFELSSGGGEIGQHSPVSYMMVAMPSDPEKQREIMDFINYIR